MKRLLLLVVAALVVGAAPAVGGDTVPRPKDWVEYETLVYGHKGNINEALRNTRPALRAAFEHGADGVEFDVVPTKDNMPLVLSDSNLANSTTCTGQAHHYDYLWLKANCRLKNGDVLFNVYDALVVVRQYKGKALIHVKSTKNTTMAGRIVHAINKYGLNRGQHVAVFGSYPTMMQVFKDKGVTRVGLIFNNSATHYWTATSWSMLVLYNTPADPVKVRAAQARGIEVVAVESYPADMNPERAEELGLDGIIADTFPR